MVATDHNCSVRCAGRLPACKTGQLLGFARAATSKWGSAAGHEPVRHSREQRAAAAHVLVAPGPVESESRRSAHIRSRDRAALEAIAVRDLVFAGDGFSDLAAELLRAEQETAAVLFA